MLDPRLLEHGLRLAAEGLWSAPRPVIGVTPEAVLEGARRYYEWFSTDRRDAIALLENLANQLQAARLATDDPSGEC